MKAQFNHLLEVQRAKVQNLESQVCNAKLTYADALRNLEQISDEIHRTRSKTQYTLAKAKDVKKNPAPETIGSFPEFPYQEEDEYMSLPATLSTTSSPVQGPLSEVEGYRNVPAKPKVTQSQSGEWTEINLEVSSPEEDIPYRRLDGTGDKIDDKPKLIKQKTMPTTESEYLSSAKTKSLKDSAIANWITRSSVKEQDGSLNGSKLTKLNSLSKCTFLLS